jgi:hypothetical protein
MERRSVRQVKLWLLGRNQKVLLTVPRSLPETRRPHHGLLFLIIHARVGVDGTELTSRYEILNMALTN